MINIPTSYHTIILYLGILAVMITSCFPNRTKLTDKELKWLVYEPGEVLVFESEIGQRDTVFITDISVDFLGALGNENKPQFGRIQIRYKPLFSDRTTLSGMLNIFAPAPINENYGELYFTFRQGYMHKLRMDEVEKLKVDALEIRGLVYRNVYVFDKPYDTEFGPDRHRNETKTAYWTMEEGVVGYADYNGNQWRLISRTPGVAPDQ